MKKNNRKLDQLIRNLDRVTTENSIFNYKSERRAFLSLGQGNINDWLESLLPNTRIIIEPKIIGKVIGIQYINGRLNKAINKNSLDITESVMSLRNIPKSLPIKNTIEILGVLYENANKSYKNNISDFIGVQNANYKQKMLSFCAFQIFHCNINHFQALQQLKNLYFEIPQSQFTNNISDIEIYLECWKQGKLFKSYPTNGIVLKINSRKLQKCLEENNLSIHWAYSINQ